MTARKAILASHHGLMAPAEIPRWEGSGWGVPSYADDRQDTDRKS